MTDQKVGGVALSVGSTGNDPATTAAPATPTTMELTTDTYKRMGTVKDVTRKDFIEKFIGDVKLTKTEANTYYQLIKNRHEQGKK